MKTYEVAYELRAFERARVVTKLILAYDEDDAVKIATQWLRINKGHTEHVEAVWVVREITEVEK